MRAHLRLLYEGDSETARYFRFGLLTFDLITVSFFIFSSAFEPTLLWFAIDYLIALFLILDYIARAIIADRLRRYAFGFTSVADLIVITSLLAPVLVDNLAFLRVVRMLRLMRSYHMLRELRSISPFFRRNEEVIESAANLLLFIFVTTAIVFVVESERNPNINTYLDSLYFTVATLTTTGFGDITMSDTLGRVLSVVIMVVGVGLFLRLVQTIFRPAKVSLPCPDCGLRRHDPDAVHCKHCGRVLNIATEGDW